MGIPLTRTLGLGLLALVLVLSVGCGKKGKGYSSAPVHLSAPAQVIHPQ